MEMKKINSGRLRAIGYDARARMLQVQLDNGSTLQYSRVGEDIWRSTTNGACALCGVTGKPVARKSATDRTTSHLTKLQKAQQVIGYITEEQRL